MQIYANHAPWFSNPIDSFPGRFRSFKLVELWWSVAGKAQVVGHSKTHHGNMSCFDQSKKSGNETNAYTTNPVGLYNLVPWQHIQGSKGHGVLAKVLDHSRIAWYTHGILRINCSTCSKHLKKPGLCARNTNLTVPTDDVTAIHPEQHFTHCVGCAGIFRILLASFKGCFPKPQAPRNASILGHWHSEESSGAKYP